MNKFIFAIAISLFSISASAKCGQILHQLLKAERQDVEVYAPDLVGDDEAYHLVAENNTDIPEDKVDQFTKYLYVDGIAFYSVTYASPVGDASEVLVVNKNTCDVMDRYLVYTE